MWFSLFLPSTHGHLEVGGRPRLSLLWREALEALQRLLSCGGLSSLLPWGRSIQVDLFKVIFGVGYATEVSPFSLPLSLSRWEPPSRLLRRKHFPLPCCGDFSSAREGSMEGVLLGPSPSQVFPGAFS
jgi:hypothetical protein